MASFRRPSGQATAVLLALAARPATWRSGYGLCQQLDLGAGSLYPALMWLADRGLLETTWEATSTGGRPPRHLYRLSGPGRALAEELAADPSGRPTAVWAVGAPGPGPRLEGT